MYARTHSITMKLSTVYFFLFLSISAGAEDLILKCSGLSHFELVGASGSKEEKQDREYKIENNKLLDLNEVPCELKQDEILCDSNFLNIRHFRFNQQTKKITDSISGNKGFGHYIENFEGICNE